MGSFEGRGGDVGIVIFWQNIQYYARLVWFRIPLSNQCGIRWLIMQF